MWVKGKVMWQGMEVLNDSKQWHNLEETDLTLYIDGKERYVLIADMKKKKFAVRKIKNYEVKRLRDSENA